MIFSSNFCKAQEMRRSSYAHSTDCVSIPANCQFLSQTGLLGNRPCVRLITIICASSEPIESLACAETQSAESTRSNTALLQSAEQVAASCSQYLFAARHNQNSCLGLVGPPCAISLAWNGHCCTMHCCQQVSQRRLQQQLSGQPLQQILQRLQGQGQHQ